MNKLISCSCQCCKKTTLWPSWGSKNTIMPCSLLYYILEGEIQIEINQKIIIIKKGDLLLIPEKTKFSCCLTEKLHAKKYWLHFEMKKGDNSFFDNYILPYKIHIGEDKYISSLFSQLVKVNGASSPDRQLKSASLVFELVSFYMKNCIVKEKPMIKTEIQETIAYMKNNLTNSITLNNLAENTSYEPNYFIKKFKKDTGYTPMKYINILRIEKAKSLLINTSDPVYLVMEKTGFTDFAYFSKLFKRETGYSPKLYREIYSI